MRFGVLGPIEVVNDDGEPVAIPSPSQRTILAVLLAHHGQVVGASTLLEAIWGDRPPASAVGSLRTYVSRLRRVLAGRLMTRADGWVLNLDGSELDASEFDAAIGPAASSAQLRAAVGLWRGASFAGHSDLEAVRAEAARLDRLGRVARERLAAALLEEGRVGEAVAEAERLVAEESLAEPGWITLVHALTIAGRQAEALRAYQQAAAALADVGLEPSPALRAAETTALASGVPPAPGLVPVPASSLVGREDTLAALDVLVEEHVLVTVVGPGGVGKTRLALELARRRAGRHARGCRVVEFSRLQATDIAADAVIDALGLVRGSSSIEDTLARIGDLDLLLVLDNCEHIAEQAAQLADRIVRSGQRVRLLATSRERLAVPGERVMVLVPLALGPDGPAAQLFTERAAAVGAPPLADRALAERIVERVDGLPLAIEMAAALLDALSYREVADLLHGELDRLGLGSRVAEPRHQTLAAAIDWSVRLLDESDRRSFAEFSVFAGPVVRDDIEAVVSGPDPFGAVRRLVARSLISADRNSETTSYRLLQPIRVHAQRDLNEHDRFEVAGRHARHFLAVADLADRSLRTSAEVDGHHRLNAVFDELRSAHRWARTNAPELAADMSRALQVWAYMSARDECLGWAELALDGPAGKHPAILGSIATRASYDGRLDVALRLAHAAIDAAPRAPESLQAYGAVADAHMYGGDLPEAIVWARRGAEVAERHGDLHHWSLGRVNASLSLCYLGDRTAALEELRSIDHLPLGPTNRASVEFARGEAIAEEDPARALSCYETAKALADSVGSRFMSAVAATAIGALAARQGEPAAALRTFADVIAYWRQTSADVHLLTTLRNLPTLLQRMGAAPECAMVLGAVGRLDVSPTFGDEAARLDAARTWTHDHLGPEIFNDHYATGATTATLDDAARLAIEILSCVAQSAAEGNLAWVREAELVRVRSTQVLLAE